MLVDNEEILPVLANNVFVMMVEATKSIVLIVLAWIELVNREKVDIVLGKLVIPPPPAVYTCPLIEDIHNDCALM